jgi:hypothetical protein
VACTPAMAIATDPAVLRLLTGFGVLAAGGYDAVPVPGKVPRKVPRGS